MEKILKIYTEDSYEDEVLTAPYYFVTYIDDYNNTRIATVKEERYLRFLEDRYYVKDYKLVGQFNESEVDRIEK